MGDNVSAGRDAGEDSRLVKFTQVKKGVLVSERPGQVVPIENIISDVELDDSGILHLRFLYGNANPVLDISDSSDVDHVLAVAQLSREEVGKLCDRTVTNYIGEDDRNYGVCFGTMSVDEAEAHDVYVEK